MLDKLEHLRASGENAVGGDVGVVRVQRRKLAATPLVLLQQWQLAAGMMIKSFQRIRKGTGIEDLHPHIFRYSHATMLHELGVDDKTIQRWEDHASQATTTNFYIKGSRDMTDKAMMALSEFTEGCSESCIS